MIKQINVTKAFCGLLLLMLSTFISCFQEETYYKATIETSQVTSITEATAICGGMISADGGSNVTARGVCWSTTTNPTIENDTTFDAEGTGPFVSLLKGLSPSTTYFVRAYAVNKGGAGYGNEVCFTTNAEVVVTDMDGNVYKTVKIGTQRWMIENLKTTKFNDGTPIPLVTNGAAWTALKTPGYCFYNNDVANKSTYGALYNWYTVNTNKLAPTGWHVPTDAEWSILENYLIANGYNFDGTTTDNKIAKSLAATTLWHTNTGVGAIGNDLNKNNKSGFTGLPGGFRRLASTFDDIGYYGWWWSSTQGNAKSAWFRYLTYAGGNVNRANYGDMNDGFSVRCIKD